MLSWLSLEPVFYPCPQPVIVIWIQEEEEHWKKRGLPETDIQSKVPRKDTRLAGDGVSRLSAGDMLVAVCWAPRRC